MDNNTLRQQMIQKRLLLSSEERLRRSDLIADRVCELEEYRNADKLLIYADHNGEVATDRLIRMALLAGKEIYMPVCETGLRLEFYRVFDIDELLPGAYGIREPLRIEYLRLSDEAVNDNTLCIVPGTVFDKAGNRLGYGKGYYDRYLGRTHIKHRIGAAYDFQITDKLSLKAHDIPMTAIISDTE